jgi:hypothetical protein
MKNPLVCAKYGCIENIGEKPVVCSDCKYEILHALDSGVKIGIHARPRRSGKTTILVDLVNQFREFKVSMVVLTPTHAIRVQFEQLCGVKRRIGSLQVFTVAEFESNFRYLLGHSNPVYYFSDEVSPDGIWKFQNRYQRVLRNWQYVLGFYTPVPSS